MLLFLAILFFKNVFTLDKKIVENSANSFRISVVLQELIDSGNYFQHEGKTRNIACRKGKNLPRLFIFFSYFSSARIFPAVCFPFGFFNFFICFNF